MPTYTPPYLAPQGTGPLEGADLEDAVHDCIAGITGLTGSLVRPRWQPEPGNIPAAATAWAAFGFENRVTSEFPEVIHDGAANTGAGADRLHQHETLTVRTSFYDLGAAGLADKYAALLRDGLFIAQNREALAQAGGILLVSVGDASPAPILLKERWLYRVDLTFTIRRQIDRTYAVPNITSASAKVLTETGAEPARETDIIVTNVP
jgi:hypothetical protein